MARVIACDGTRRMMPIEARTYPKFVAGFAKPSPDRIVPVASGKSELSESVPAKARLRDDVARGGPAPSSPALCIAPLLLRERVRIPHAAVRLHIILLRARGNGGRRDCADRSSRALFPSGRAGCAIPRA